MDNKRNVNFSGSNGGRIGDGQGDDKKRNPGGGGSNEDNKAASSHAGNIMKATLLFGVATSEVPPIAAAIIVGGALAASVAVIHDALVGTNSRGVKGNEGTHTTFQHHSQSSLNNKPTGFDPKQPPNNSNNAVKWLIAGRLIYEVYDKYDKSINTPTLSLPNNNNLVPQFVPYRQK